MAFHIFLNVIGDDQYRIAFQFQQQLTRFF